MGVGPGYAISKHVKLVRLLSRGGMGSVWIADHLALKTRVAVKFMSDMFSDDAGMLTRFQREATSAAQIGSPHIVSIHDHGIAADGTPYMVMELLEGEDVSARIKRAGPLPLEHVAKIVSQTCKALGKAHRLGIVHRDIKPNNIFLVDAEGDIFVKVLDFGIAKPGGGESSEVTSTGAIVGTVIYASPEQLVNAKSVDFRADLWSLGVVAYRAMTGKLPFSDANGIGALALAQANEQFVPPSKMVNDIPLEVDEWCKRAFKYDPAARFESAREMADAFYTACGRTSSPSLIRTSPTTKAAPLHDADTETVVERSSSTSSSSTKDVAPSEVTKNPFGAASAMTVAGESTTNTSLATRRWRRIVVVAAVITSLLSAGALTFVLLKRVSHPIATETSNAIAAPPAPSTMDIQVVPVSSRVEVTSPPSAPSASASSATVPSASASTAAAPSASATDPKARTKQGGSSRNPLPEKDYGF